MERFVMDRLVAWKNSARRKPLILNGARQVGKTWLLKEFGARHFANVAYVNLDNNPGMKAQFERGYDVPRLLKMIQAETGEPVVAGQTLVVLDEIQECPKALTALKYFCEDAPEYAVAVAGSLLGVKVHEGTGYPVGKVQTLDVYPLSFREFLDATGNAALRAAVDEGDEGLLNALQAKIEPLLRQYYCTGGMPEVVSAYVEGATYQEVRHIQDDILYGYERDMSKHLSPKETESALAVWASVPAQLGKENKKFVFGHVKDGARARDYRAAITWLVNAGLAVRVPRVSKPGVPLSAYADDAFKLFMLDVGLLGAMAGLDAGSVVEGNRVYTEFKGALTEQYVCQQLVGDCGFKPYYWSAENSRGEIDFLVQDGRGRIYPIEVKAEENLQAKSLRAFVEKYEGVHAVRTSLSGFRTDGWLRNVPLWAIGNAATWAAE